MPLTAEQQLIRLYRAAATQLRKQIRDDLRDGRIGSAVWRQRQVRAIRQQLEQLGERTRATPVEIIATGYDRGAQIVDRIAGRAGAVAYAFHGAHRRPALALAENLAHGLDGARAVVGRRVEDVYRRAALEVVGTNVAASATRRETSAALERRLIRDGVTGFVDRRGAQWQMDTYVEMVTRTTTREAMTEGTRRRMLETDQDLVTISTHGTEDDLCQQYEGNTYSLTGKTPGYDVLDQAPPFHPRCLHVMTPAAENLDAMLRGLGVAAETGAG